MTSKGSSYWLSQPLSAAAADRTIAGRNAAADSPKSRMSPTSRLFSGRPSSTVSLLAQPPDPARKDARMTASSTPFDIAFSTIPVPIIRNIRSASPANKWTKAVCSAGAFIDNGTVREKASGPERNSPRFCAVWTHACNIGAIQHEMKDLIMFSTKLLTAPSSCRLRRRLRRSGLGRQRRLLRLQRRLGLVRQHLRLDRRLQQQLERRQARRCRRLSSDRRRPGAGQGQHHAPDPARGRRRRRPGIHPRRAEPRPGRSAVGAGRTRARERARVRLRIRLRRHQTAFFLALQDDWYRELGSRQVTI
jgi:hypothetical protein